MRLEDLTAKELQHRLHSGLVFQSGPFLIQLRSDIPELARTLQQAYGPLTLGDPNNECPHYRIGVCRQRGIRGYLRPQAVFAFEGMRPFDPYPLDQAFPLFEWGLNWAIATTAHQYLLLHSAVVERDGHAVLLPATPGSGKSTLCAALVSRGWRLLSDEFGVLRPEDGAVMPLPRAAPLKNDSIDVIRLYAPHVNLGPRFERTRKGTVVHLFPPRDSLQRQTDSATPGLVVFPRYNANSALSVVEQPVEQALTRLINNSFNYPVTGSAGFQALCGMIKRTPAFEIHYNDLDAAIDAIERQLSKATEATEATAS